MSRKQSRVILLVLLVICTFVDPIASDPPKKEITMAILPCFDIVMAFKKFHPLIEYLEEQTGMETRMMVQTNFSEFELAMRNEDIDIVIQDPHTYVRLAGLYNKDSLLRALTDDGQASRRGVIIVRKDSGIKEIEDLKGKTVMFGPKQSIAKWIAARLLIEQNGINVDEDLRAYKNGGCCDDIAFNVYLKAVDAGAVCEHFMTGVHADSQKQLGIDMDQMVVIGETELFPSKVFAIRKMVDSSIANVVVDALLGLDNANPDHAAILHSAELGGFQRVSDEDYDSIRELIGLKPFGTRETGQP